MSVSSVPEPEVIDNRRHNFTQIDNEVFDLYAPHIGPQGIALYCALVRFAYQDKATYPSHTNLGKKSGMSSRSVQKYLPALTKDNPELAAHNLSPLVEIRHRKRPDGGDASNLYIILPIAKSAPPPRQTYSDPPTKAFADDEYVAYQDGSVTETSSVTGAGAQAAPKTKPLPTNGPAQQIVKAFCEATGISQPTSYKQAVGIAQKLSDAGITPEQIPDFVAWMQADKWLKDKIDLPMMVRQADKWRSGKASPGPVKRFVV